MVRYNTEKTTASEPISCEIALIASQFIRLHCHAVAVPVRLGPKADRSCKSLRFLGDLEHDLSASVTGLDLLVCFHRLNHRKRLGNNYSDLFLVDQFSNFSQFGRARAYRNRRTADTVFV